VLKNYENRTYHYPQPVEGSDQTRSRALPMVGASVPGGLCGSGTMDD